LIRWHRTGRDVQALLPYFHRASNANRSTAADIV
jgi:hypothetical protein